MVIPSRGLLNKSYVQRLISIRKRKLSLKTIDMYYTVHLSPMDMVKIKSRLQKRKQCGKVTELSRVRVPFLQPGRKTILNTQQRLPLPDIRYIKGLVQRQSNNQNALKLYNLSRCRLPIHSMISEMVMHQTETVDGRLECRNIHLFFKCLMLRSI